jgi:eukaryotic-like serine/threonine-protein kinase
MATPSQLIGQTISHYRIVEKLGSGGMGVVYRAHDERLDRDVALKVLPDGMLSDETARKRFLKEARTLSQLSHPNIATVFDFDHEHSTDFLVMELIPGITLDRKIAAGPLAEKEIIGIGEQVARALEEAHEHGIVHRDLKPGNVMVTPKGQVKVLDFGLARLLKPRDPNATESFTEADAVAGTLPYMAPEQLRGDAVDQRTDIYAAGAVLYEMSTGKRPFESKVSTALVDDIIHKPLVPPAQLKPSLPSRLEDVILKCLEKDPENRYQSAKELLVDLRRLTAPSTATRVVHGTRRSWRYATGLALVLIVIALVGTNVARRQRPPVPAPRVQSLAVLPLQNFSADPEQQYFVDGMTEAVISDLAKIQALKVISRTSVMPYKNSKKSMRDIANELHADAVIEGSVMRSADRVRITVQLIDASSDRHLWTESYERELKNVFALQGEVAQAIAQQVRAVVTPQEQERLAQKRPIDPEVYELYLKGRHIMMRGDLEDVRTAIEHFQSGLMKDPNNALLYTGLADAYIDKMIDVHESPVEATVKARAAATKALELDDSLAEAHTSLGAIKLYYDWDWTSAEHELKRAIELNPGYPLAYVIYGEYLTIVGRNAEAIPYFEKAHGLDPLLGDSYATRGYSLFMAHKYEDAIGQYRKALELEPDAITYFGLVLARAEKGDYTTAIAEAEKATKLNHSPLLLTALASAYARAGRRADANRVLRRLEEISKQQGPAPAWHAVGTPYVCPYEVAGVYAQLGEKDRAFEWLDKAYRGRSCMYWLRQDPRLDSIHSDPRFQELLTKMKFPQ